MKKFAKINSSICRRISATVVIASALGILAACGGGDSTVFSNNSQITTSNALLFAQEISTKNGYLVFKDQEQFDDTVRKIRTMKKDQLNEWFAQHSEYTPMTTAFASVSEEANAYFANAEKSTSLISDAQAKAFMYQIAEKNKNNSHIEEKKDGRHLERNISDPALSLILNQDGLVEINGKLLQYIKDNIRSEIFESTRQKLFASKFCPVEAKAFILKACTPIKPDEPDEPHNPSGPVSIATENDGYTLFSIEPTVLQTAERGTMVFKVKRIQTDPNPVNKADSYYSFHLLDSLDTASSDDLGLITVSDNAQLKKTNSGTQIQVKAGAEDFEFSIAIREDYTAEDIETVSITIGSMRSRQGQIAANSVPECNGCQNWNAEYFASVHKDGLKMRDFLEQKRIGDKIYTAHIIYLTSQKLNAWGNWVNEDANMAMEAHIRGNKRGYINNYGDGISSLDTELFVSWDDPWDIPHVDSAYIRGIRTGGKSGVDVVASY